MGQALAIAGVTLGAEAVAGMARRAWGAASFNSDFRRMVEANPDLKGADSQKVLDRFRILARLGPTLSKDPTVAGGWVRQTMEFPVITPTVLRDLVDVEQRARDLQSPFGGGTKGMSQLVGSHLSRGILSRDFPGE